MEEKVIEEGPWKFSNTVEKESRRLCRIEERQIVTEPFVFRDGTETSALPLKVTGRPISNRQANHLCNCELKDSWHLTVWHNYSSSDCHFDLLENKTISGELPQRAATRQETPQLKKSPSYCMYLRLIPQTNSSNTHTHRQNLLYVPVLTPQTNSSNTHTL